MMALRIMGLFHWRYRKTDSGHCRRLALTSKVSIRGGYLRICLPSVAQADVQQYDRAPTWEGSCVHHLCMSVDTRHCPLVRPKLIWMRVVQIYIFSYLMRSQIALYAIQNLSKQLHIKKRKITVVMLLKFISVQIVQL